MREHKPLGFIYPILFLTEAYDKQKITQDKFQNICSLHC
jgi:hypothetical protein